MKHSSTPKLYHSIKEIGELFDEEQHILRYWEREFECLNPSKNRAGNRVYTDKDIRVLKVIKKLLRVDRLPVVNVKDLLKNGISDQLFLDSESVVNIETPDEQVVENAQKDSASIEDEFVRIRREDLHHVIKVLHDVSLHIESL